MTLSTKLPSRFPVGTKFVIEGRPGGKGKLQISKRYLEFPDGRLIRLPAYPQGRAPARCASGTRRKNRRS
jgi:hypothetical protein